MQTPTTLQAETRAALGGPAGPAALDALQIEALVLNLDAALRVHARSILRDEFGRESTISVSNPTTFGQATPLVFDAMRGRTLACNAVTLAWDGAGWTALTTPIAPSPRTEHAVAYDILRGNGIELGKKDFLIS